MAAIERKQEAQYALDETPRNATMHSKYPPDHPTSRRCSRAKAVPIALPTDACADTPSESEPSSNDYSPDETPGPTGDDKATEDGEATEETTDAEPPRRRKQKGKGCKEKCRIRTAISHRKESMGVESLETRTPRPASKQTTQPTHSRLIQESDASVSTYS
jgi:hypothetical protein